VNGADTHPGIGTQPSAYGDCFGISLAEFPTFLE
jgi:hypothetical protein